MFAVCIRIHQTFILRKNTNTFLYRSYDRQTDIVTGRQQAGSRQAYRQTDRQTDRQKDRKTGGQAGRKQAAGSRQQAERQRDRETKARTNKQTNKQTKKQASSALLPYYLVKLCKNTVTNYSFPVILFFFCREPIAPVPC